MYTDAEPGCFDAERHVLRQKAWQSWVGAEQVAAFAELNCEAAAQLAAHADRTLGTTSGADLRAFLYINEDSSPENHDSSR